MFTLGRKVDVSYTTNKIILTASIIVAIIGYFITRELFTGLSIAVGTFLTWALAREVDPKHDYSAFLSAAITLINLFYYNNIQLLVLFWIILLLRMISGCTGRKITLIDILSIFGLSTFLFISNENSIYIIPFIIGMATLIFFKEETKVAIAFLAIAIIGFLIGSFYFNYLLFSSTEFSSLVKITVTVFLVLSILLINYIKISGLLDDTGKEVVSTRIRLSQMICPAIILLLFWFTPMSYGNLLIYLAVLIGIFLYSLFSRILKF